MKTRCNIETMSQTKQNKTERDEKKWGTEITKKRKNRK